MNDVIKLRALDAFNACEVSVAMVSPGAEFVAPPKVAVDLVARGLAEVMPDAVEAVETIAIVEHVQPATTARNKSSPTHPA